MRAHFRSEMSPFLLALVSWGIAVFRRNSPDIPICNESGKICIQT